MNTTADKLNKLIATKAAIKAAIEAKGVADVGDKFADYPDKIRQIPSQEYEVLNLTITTNQPTNELPLNQVIHVRYATEDDTYVWRGSTVAIKVPKYATYTVVFPEVEGYRKPADATYVAVGNNTRSLTASYDTELLTVTLSCEVPSVSLAGQEVTIDGKVYQASGSHTVVAKIPFGKKYTIDASPRDGFSTPEKQTFTAGQASRNVSVVYAKLGLGIYILHTNGICYTQHQWNTAWNSEAVGVCVLTDNCSFVMAPDIYRGNKFSKTGLIANITTTTSSTEAKQDYNGKSNTDAVINQLGESGAPAASYCKKYTFKNGAKGYMAALGEVNEILTNIKEIDGCLSLIGAEKLAGIGTVASNTQYNDKYMWGAVIAATTSYVTYYNKDSSPFAAIPLTPPY